MLLAGTVLLLFQTRDVQVEGNEYYGDNTVVSWIREDELSANTLYIYLKYKYTDAQLPSGVEEIRISLDNPWTVRVTVVEKEMAGYVDLDGSHLYFDRIGTVTLKTDRLIEGVPYIEGLAFDSSRVFLGEALPVEDEVVLSRIVEVSGKLRKYSLEPDRLVCADGHIMLYFGVVEVLLGTENYDERVAQISPILSELEVRYPGTAGTLHLENYDISSPSVRFVPAV